MRQVASDRKKFKISRTVWWVVNREAQKWARPRGPSGSGTRDFYHLLWVETPLPATWTQKLGWYRSWLWLSPAVAPWPVHSLC